jgi:hypothetical protein
MAHLDGNLFRLLDDFHLDVDVDFVADENAAGFQRLVPRQPPLLAVNDGAPWKSSCGAPRTEFGYGKRQFARSSDIISLRV